jgi:hypothetical protein
MSLDLAIIIAKLCTYVAFLGEKDQKNWWSSSFLSSSGATFLNPVFQKTSLLARVTGASAAAQVVHDKHIGIGNVFHLFRLPESIEHDVFQVLTTELSIQDNISSEDDACASLQTLANGDTTQGIGPLLLNHSKIDQASISQMAAAYLAGFKNNKPVYPFYKG